LLKEEVFDEFYKSLHYHLFSSRTKSLFIGLKSKPQAGLLPPLEFRASPQFPVTGSKDAPAVICGVSYPYTFRVLNCVKAKFHYASWFEGGSKLDRAEIWPII